MNKMSEQRKTDYKFAVEFCGWRYVDVLDYKGDKVALLVEDMTKDYGGFWNVAVEGHRSIPEVPFYTKDAELLRSVVKEFLDRHNLIEKETSPSSGTEHTCRLGPWMSDKDEIEATGNTYAEAFCKALIKAKEKFGNSR